MGIQIHRAIKPLVDLGIASIKAAANIWTGSNKFTGTVSLSGAEPADTLTLTEKGLWQDYFDVPSTDQALGAVHFDYPQTLTAPQQAQARANIGVVTAGGVAAVSGEMTPATGIAATDFAAYAHTDGAITGVLFRIVHAGGTYDVSGADSRFGSAISRGVEFASATGVLTFYADGVAHATTQALSAGSVVISKVLSAATGTLRSSAIFNRALTADERAAVMRWAFTAAMKPACLARYEPENVTSLGRWLDSSGNGYDLIPGAGITPLKPQPVQVRFESLVYSTADSVKQKGSWGCAKVRAGVINVVYPTYLHAKCNAYPNNSFISSTAMACLDGFDAAYFVVGARYVKTSQYFRLLSGQTETEGIISILFTWFE